MKRQLASLQKRYDNADARLKMLQAQLDDGDAGPITSYLPVADILDEMLDFRIGSKSRRADTRRLNFLMESLIRQAMRPCLGIRKFLEKMEDDRRDPSGGRGRRGVRKGYRNFRATLSAAAECASRWWMCWPRLVPPQQRRSWPNCSKPPRGFEIAYTARALRSWLGDDAYSKDAIAAAHEPRIEPVEVPRNYSIVFPWCWTCTRTRLRPERPGHVHQR